MAYLPFNRLLAVFPLVLCLYLASSALMAGQTGCSDSNATAATSPDSGLTAYIDPQTGELLDQPPQGSSELPETPSSQEQEYVVEKMPDGSERINLEGRETTLQAELDGEKLISCHGRVMPESNAAETDRPVSDEQRP